MKKLAIAVIVTLALSAVAFVSTRLATDDGGIAVNHSQGVAVFPYAKLKIGTSAKTIPFYTIAAEWPTTFVPETIVWDGGVGCVKRALTETPYANTPSGAVAGLPIYCIIKVPLAALDAGVHTIYRDTDGGYGVSTCASAATVPTNGWTAFCNRQAGISP